MGEKEKQKNQTRRKKKKKNNKIRDLSFNLLQIALNVKSKSITEKMIWKLNEQNK
jgi:hypothetical protein